MEQIFLIIPAFIIIALTYIPCMAIYTTIERYRIKRSQRYFLQQSLINEGNRIQRYINKGYSDYHAILLANNDIKPSDIKQKEKNKND